MKQKIYSLYEIVSYLQEHFEKRRLEKGSFWVKAEINKLNHYPNGACYPELIQKKEDKIIAKASAYISPFIFAKISEKLKQYNHKLQDGLLVVFKGYIYYDKIRGIKFKIEDLNVEEFLGSIEKEKLENIKKLKQLGIFENNKQKLLPSLLQNIAVISVASGKGFQDFKHIIEKSPYKINYQLFSASMQGKNVVSSIKQQLTKIDKKFDVLVIIRGGGSDTELVEFNNFELAKLICNFHLPVLSAIGHSSNQSVLELVSYKSFITPTDLANFIVDNFRQFDENLKFYKDFLNNKLSQLYEELNLKEKKLFNYKNLLYKISFQQVLNKQEQIDYLKSILNSSIKNLILQKENLLDKSKQNLLSSAQSLINIKETNLEKLKLRLDALDINKIFDKGFSLVFKDNQLVKNPKNIKKGDILEIKFKNESIKVKVL